MTDVLELTKQALMLVLILSAPPVAAAALVGLAVAFLQAATQLQEQTFAYALKFLTIVVTLFLTASMIGGTLYTFADRIFIDFPGLVRHWRQRCVDYSSISNVMLALALTTPRIIGAFLMLPLLTTETVPAMVRNSFMVSLAIVVLPIAMAGAPLDGMGPMSWAPIIVKELFLGVAIGFCFGIVFWALGAAGNVIDNQVGMGMAQVFDPLQGHQASLHATFLSQFATWLFMASGAFLVFLDLLLSSYVMWPVLSFVPTLQINGLHLFIGQFSYLMTALLVLAAPAMVVLLFIDIAFGLVNRFAPQLNVFSVTMPIKAWLGTAMILLLLGVYIEIVLDRLNQNRGLLRALNAAFT